MRLFKLNTCKVLLQDTMSGAQLGLRAYFNSNILEFVTSCFNMRAFLTLNWCS